MQVTINEVVDTETNERTYEYQMYDGPDGIDDYSGLAKSIGECCEMIVRNRFITELSYSEDVNMQKHLCGKNG